MSLCGAVSVQFFQADNDSPAEPPFSIPVSVASEEGSGSAAARSPVHMTNSKLALAATLKVTSASVGLDGAIQPTAWNALFHRASVATEFPMPQCKDYIDSFQWDRFIFRLCILTSPLPVLQS